MTVDIPLADLMNMARDMARAAGMDVPGAAAGAASAASPADAASDPSGSTTLFKAVQALGLKLEPRKSVVEHLVVDHVEKTPTGN